MCGRVHRNRPRIALWGQGVPGRAGRQVEVSLPAPDAQLPANPFELLSGLGDVQPCQSGGRRNVLRLDLGVPQQHLPSSGSRLKALTNRQRCCLEVPSVGSWSCQRHLAGATFTCTPTPGRGEVRRRPSACFTALNPRQPAESRDLTQQRAPRGAEPSHRTAVGPPQHWHDPASVTVTAPLIADRSRLTTSQPRHRCCTVAEGLVYAFCVALLFRVFLLLCFHDENR